MLRIGLTGGIGSGKSTLAGLLVARGAGLIDADAISRALTGPGGAALPAIVAAFGPAVLAADGALDRAAMRRRVFADPAARHTLEGIVHPLVRRASAARAATLVAPYLVFDIPLLVESADPRATVDRVLVVDCPVPVQVARAIARGPLARDEVLAIVRAQATRAARLAVADDVVVNDGSRADLESAADRLHERFGGPAPGPSPRV